MEDFEIQDGSNDKAYFTMVPNIVLNHSSAVDQALYMQMKRFAGEKRGGSLCYASEKTLMAKLKIGRDSLKESISYLIEHGWIALVGEKNVMTAGGPQKVKAYRVNDIWKMNVDHYKGVSESAYLHEGVAETVKGVSRTAQGVAETAPTKNNRTNKTSREFGNSQFEEVRVSDEEKPKRESSAKYPHALEVFALWGAFPKNWTSLKESRQREAAENLYQEQGIEEIKNALAWHDRLKGIEFCPQIHTPHDLDTKWGKLEDFVEKHS